MICNNISKEEGRVLRSFAVAVFFCVLSVSWLVFSAIFYDFLKETSLHHNEGWSDEIRSASDGISFLAQ